ncbi:MAG: RluA family pseudouridine synthase [Desulfobacterales bacterium]|nr:RluA family pseudouridine synthase [Desulfobacterales bacterium]
MHDNSALTFLIEQSDDGKRFDAVISAHVPECSRSFAAARIREGHFLLNGDKKKPAYRVKSGEIITGKIPPPETVDYKPEPIDVNILYEDSDVIVVNKQSGLVVHPAPGHYSGTLVNGLLYHCPDIEGIGGKIRPGIVHRLDKDTSGVMVVAKNDMAHNHLSVQFKSRETKKEYLALVYGRVKAKSGRIDFSVGRHPTDRKKMSTNSKRGRSAETLWTVKERFDGATLLNLNIKTGRTHQIRVHCAAIHHPVVGDPVYAGRKAGRGLTGSKPIVDLLKSAKRQMLHAFRIQFIHPKSGEKMIFEAALPTDMATVIAGLKSSDHL